MNAKPHNHPLQSFTTRTLALSALCLNLILLAMPRAAGAQISGAQIPVGLAAPAADSSTLPAPWIGQDLGNPTVTGSSVLNTQRFVIAGSGDGIAGVNDQFRFVYQPLAGNVQIKARLVAWAPDASAARAGLMIRSSLSPDAAHGALLMNAGGDLAFRYRRQDGAVTTPNAGQAASAVPQWIALERIGAQIAAYASPDGKAWTAIGSAAIQLGETVYVGMAVTSGDISETATAKISRVSVAGLPLSQRQHNVGGPVVNGSAWLAQGTYTITGGGAIGDEGDRFSFVYQTMQGDVDIVARVASLADVNRRAKAGVMIRESLTPGSRHAFALVSKGDGYAFEGREQTGGGSEHVDGGAGAAPGWVRLVRSGSLISAFRSTDGLTWTPMGSTELVMDQQVYVGLAVTSDDASAVATADVDGVGIAGAVTAPIGGLPNLPPVITLTSPTPGATFTAPATVTLSALAVDPEGRLTDVKYYANANLVGTAATSPYSFTWSSVPAGSYTLTAVATDGDGGSTTSASVTITVNPGANQSPSVTLTSPVSGATFTAPATITVAADASDPENRLARVEFYEGTTLLGTDTTSPFSFTWSSVAAGSYTLKAVATDADGGTATSTAVSITVNAAPNQPPTVTLTSPASGATFTAPATITLTADASDAENRLTRVRFYQGSTLLGNDTTSPFSFTWSSVAAGSYTLKAVAVDADGGSTTSATLSITVNTTPNQPPSVTLTSPASGATFTAPATVTLAANASDPENELARVEFYQGSTLLGTDTTSPFSFAWSSVAAGSYTIKAVAVDADGGTATSATASITVNAAPNQPPSVTLTSPASGATFTAPATIAMTASASDPENRLARVEFYRGSTLLGTDTTSPFSFTWSSVAAGSYTLKAVAVDADGGTTSSATVNVTVTAGGGGGGSWVTTFTASSEHNTTVTSYLLEVFANGVDPTTGQSTASTNLGKPAPDANGMISFNGASFFGALSPGTYTVTVSAVASDGSGRSAPVTITR